jgi:hypothetical protein
MQNSDISRIPINIILEGIGEARGELIRFLAPRTIEQLIHLLPLQGRVAIWNDQYYFGVPVKTGPEKATLEPAGGDIAYWPMGNSVCIFTKPMRPHSPVNRIGKVLTGLEKFRNVHSGTPIKVERLSGT